MKLMKITYYDSSAEVRLEAYADTVVLEKTDDRRNCIAAIRFGDYAESVKGVTEAIYGGGSVSLELDNGLITLSSYVKRYRKE